MEKLQIDIDGKSHPKQADFIYDPTFATAFIGARDSGKTMGGVLKTITKLLKIFQYRKENPSIFVPNILVTAPSYPTIFQPVVPTYERVLRQYGLLAPEKGLGRVIESIPPRIEVGYNMGEIFFRTTDDPKLLRGGEYIACHMDEARDSPEEAFDVILPTLRQPFPNPQIWITTTPYGFDHWTYRRWNTDNKLYYRYQCSMWENGFLSEAQKQLMVDSHKGLNEDWLAQELGGEYVMITGQCRFNTKVLRKALGETREPIYTDGAVEIYKEPVIGRGYIAGGDAAEGLAGGDRSCIQIFDAQKGEQVCVIHGQIPPYELAYLADKYCRKYNNALFSIPNAPAGSDRATFDKLKELGYTNIYELQKGWRATELWKGMAEAELAEAVANGELIFYRRNTIQELLSYARQADGRYRGAKGCFDDEVSALMVMWQLIKEPRTFMRPSQMKPYSYVRWR